MRDLGEKTAGDKMNAPGRDAVLVSLVTYHDETFLERCLESVCRQSVPVRVKVFDNGSHDGTRDAARRFDVAWLESGKNRGYSYGHNRNLENEDFRYALLLNADVVLQKDYLERLLATLDAVEGAGMAGGKLYRMDTRGCLILRRRRPLLDSTGIFFTPSQRHFDRGSEQEDRGQYDRRQLVFGITGAALLCRKSMLDDVKIDGEYLDEDFFAYREDADLAWRAQLRGWKAIYEPAAVAWHHRQVMPSRRRQLSPLVNYHSLKNRYLMRLKNLDPAVRRKCFPYMWIRDAGIIVYALLFEWSSLSAYGQVWRLRERFRGKRKQVQSSRRAGPEEVARWFSFTPMAYDL